MGRPGKGRSNLGANSEMQKRSGAYWSAQRIRARHADKPLFWLPGPAPEFHPLPYPFDEKRLKAASYNLKMGSEVYVSPTSESDPQSVRKLDEGGAFRIPPGQFAFLLTHEAVHIPEDAFALIALRARELQFRGLINVSGFHIDPGYSGRLVLAVYNAGPGEVHLREGSVLFEVFFADLDEPTEKPYNASSTKQPLMRIEPDVISAVAGKFETLEGLKNKIGEVETELEERIQALEREQSVTRWASALILGALIAFGVRSCAPSSASAATAAHVMSVGR